MDYVARHTASHRGHQLEGCPLCARERQTCQGKRHFGSELAAWEWVCIFLRVSKWRQLQVPYDCVYCGGWHVQSTRRLGALRALDRVCDLGPLGEDFLRLLADKPDAWIAFGCYGPLPLPHGETIRHPSARISGVSTGPLVARVQQSLGVPVSAWFDPETEDAVVEFQRVHGLPQSGAVDAPTWVALSRSR